LIENGGPLGIERQHQASPREPRVFWIDRLDELERTGIWPADWGRAPMIRLALCQYGSVESLA